MPDYREELLNKTMIMLSEAGIGELGTIKEIMIRTIGEYEIAERCTEVAVIDDKNEKIIKMFLATKKTEGGSARTARNRMYVFQRFCEDVNKPFAEIGVFDIRMWLANMQREVSLSTAESYRSMIASLFAWMSKEGFIDKNPMENIKPIKHPNVIKKSFSQLEVDALKCACETKLERAIVELLLSSGIRCEELCDLRWNDIDLHTKDIRVIEGKGNKSRTTMMDDITRKYLLEYKSGLKFESEYVFAVLYRGEIKARTRDSVWRLLKEVGKRAKVPQVNPHKFRRTFATMMYKRGMDVHMIQRLMGHSNINTTMIYIDSDTESLRDAYKRCV